MSLTNVQFVFNIFDRRGDEVTTHRLTRHANLPTSLCRPTVASPSARAECVAALRRVCARHETECLALTSRRCIMCNAAAAAPVGIMTPATYLHRDPPMVHVTVHPGCGAAACEAEVREEMARILGGEGGLGQLGGAGGTVTGGKEEDGEEEKEQVGACVVCGGARETKKCAGCMRVRYCGKGCQKKDWKAHKVVCNK